MRRVVACVAAAFVVCGGGLIEAEETLKVFISIDMEGVTSVAHWEDVSRDGKDYDLFR